MGFYRRRITLPPPMVIFAVGAAVELWGVPAILLGLAVLLAVFGVGAALTPTLKTLDQTPQHERPPTDHS